MARRDEQIGQHVDDVNRGELSPNPDRQALPGELVQDIERAEGPGVIGPVMHEVIRPDMVRALGAQPDTGSVVEPEPAAPLRLLAGHLQPLAPPQALDPLVVDQPVGVARQGGDPAIAVTAVTAGQLDHVGDQAILVVVAARDTALGRAVLPQHPAGATLRDPEPAADMVDAVATARGA